MKKVMYQIKGLKGGKKVKVGEISVPNPQFSFPNSEFRTLISGFRTLISGFRTLISQFGTRNLKPGRLISGFGTLNLHFGRLISEFGKLFSNHSMSFISIYILIKSYYLQFKLN
jgi:hypothetical protein